VSTKPGQVHTRPRPGPKTADAPEREKARLLQALEEARWHRGHAAERLGVSRRHFYRLMEKYGIEAGE